VGLCRSCCAGLCLQHLGEAAADLSANVLAMPPRHLGGATRCACEQHLPRGPAPRARLKLTSTLIVGGRVREQRQPGFERGLAPASELRQGVSADDVPGARAGAPRRLDARWGPVRGRGARHASRSSRPADRGGAAPAAPKRSAGAGPPDRRSARRPPRARALAARLCRWVKLTCPCPNERRRVPALLPPAHFRVRLCPNVR
jgi:hypothetical protein